MRGLLSGGRHQPGASLTSAEMGGQRTRWGLAPKRFQNRIAGHHGVMILISISALMALSVNYHHYLGKSPYYHEVTCSVRGNGDCVEVVGG
jgi:hypothetical protein